MVKTVIRSENAEFQIIQSLKLNRSKRNQLREVFIEGTECIKQAAAAGWEITRVITAAAAKLSDWAKALMEVHEGASFVEMRKELYDSLCDKAVPAELLVTAKIRNRPPPEERLPDRPFVLVLDRPGDFGNLGSVIRSANAFGVDAVFILGHGADIYEPKVIRASLGSVFHTNIGYLESVEKLTGIIEREKAKGMEVIGTDSGGSVSLDGRRLERPVMIILGNEAKGMSVRLRQLCDTIVRIPLSGQVNSLNVSCAASIVLWEVYKHECGGP
jgi:TrmH family RNA methyltransferase